VLARIACVAASNSWTMPDIELVDRLSLVVEAQLYDSGLAKLRPDGFDLQIVRFGNASIASRRGAIGRTARAETS
jgi:hypothetical protein